MRAHNFDSVLFKVNWESPSCWNLGSLQQINLLLCSSLRINHILLVMPSPEFVWNLTLSRSSGLGCSVGWRHRGFENQFSRLSPRTGTSLVKVTSVDLISTERIHPASYQILPVKRDMTRKRFRALRSNWWYCLYLELELWKRKSSLARLYNSGNRMLLFDFDAHVGYHWWAAMTNAMTDAPI